MHTCLALSLSFLFCPTGLFVYIPVPGCFNHCNFIICFTIWYTVLYTNSCEKKRSEKKGEKERYNHLNAEFQRIARRDKKAFLSDQCKEIEENSRMGQTRDLCKKIRDIKGTSHAKMGSIKDRNGLG